jgi:hypothetical protein
MPVAPNVELEERVRIVHQGLVNLATGRYEGLASARTIDSASFGW